MKVLIADDDRVFVELVATRLRSKGHKVVSAADAMQALMYAMREKPDVILLDIKMPGGSGIETLKKLKGNAKTEAIPVIVASSLDDPSMADEVVGLGATEFLAKPVSFDQVAAALGRALPLPAA